MQKVQKFFQNVASEMRKVRWPRKKELTKYTLTVITTIVFFGIFFTLVDLGISAIIELIR
jgi:preprotein translocase subunit SecE